MLGDVKTSLLPSPMHDTLALFSGSNTRAGQLCGLTGDGGVDGEGPEAGHLLPSGHLHPCAEDVLPGVQLEQLNATEHLVGLLQPLIGILLQGPRSQSGEAFDRTPSKRKAWIPGPHRQAPWSLLIHF